MKQVLQNLMNGETMIEEVPCPRPSSGQLLIRTSRSLISAGTERMLVDFGKANFIDKARQQPDKVKQVLDKVRTDGIKPTYDSVMNKLAQPLPLGYCNVGTVVAVGNGVQGFNPGDRVASNGPHAEYVAVPANLAAKIPDSVSDEAAAFTVIGAIALQGIRLLNPTFGETVVVMGLGLIGLITAELLLANGCSVIGFDFDAQKVRLATERGTTAFNLSGGLDPVSVVNGITRQRGCDGVIITASASGDEIVHQSAEMSRKRGRIILVGVVGLNLRRDDFYKKELSFQVSCSYGPGRYDDLYEQKGNDYPLPYVRWTEQRNFEAVLEAIAKGRLDVSRLITERVRFEECLQVYGDMCRQGSIATIIEYDGTLYSLPSNVIEFGKVDFEGRKGVFGIVGAGNFTASTILPHLAKTSAILRTIASSGGLSAATLARRYSISKATSDYRTIMSDDAIDTVVIATRHGVHASMVQEALDAGKNVFVEKPLALHSTELDAIVAKYRDLHENGLAPLLMVGFNRRFAPLAVKMAGLLGNGATPSNIVATMNAGFISSEVWVHDPQSGGGRIIGEACHFIDLCTWLAGSRVAAVCMNAMGPDPDESTDNASILLQYENGSNAVINYFANGSKSYAKERVEVFNQNRVLVLDNWRKLTGYGFKGFKSMVSAQDKGHADQFRLFVENVQRGGQPLIPFDELLNTTRASFAALTSLKERRWVEVC